MSKFKEAREQAILAERRRARPSALQIAWLAALLFFGGVILWLAVTAPEEAPRTSPAVIPAVTVADAMPDEVTAEAEAAAASEVTADLAAEENHSADTPAEPAPAPEEPAPIPTKDTDPDAVPQETPAPPPGTPAGDVRPADPDPALIENSASGPLPRIAADGREPWQVYARPVAGLSSRPRIALVITGAGLRKSTTTAAITTLPPEITLAFSPYGDNLPARTAEARAAGHELMLLVPMEPDDYPRNDPGPHTLLAQGEDLENLQRLRWALGRFSGYVGIVNDMGSRFTASEPAMTLVLGEAKMRGLLFMDARSSAYTVGATVARNLRVPRAVNNRYIDNEQTEEAIRARLAELETVASSYGAAAGIGRLYPVTIKVVEEWAAGLAARGFDLVPVTAIANRQPVR